MTRPINSLGLIASLRRKYAAIAPTTGNKRPNSCCCQTDIYLNATTPNQKAKKLINPAIRTNHI